MYLDKSDKRDIMAGRALQGLLAGGIYASDLNDSEICELAYKYADEMEKAAQK